MTVVAEVVRNDFVESVHHGRVVAVDGESGRVLLSVGDPDAPVLPRSALKPLQSLAMLRAGWAPDDDAYVAIASASHSGEQPHVDVVRRLLASVGLDESALDNTVGLPLSAEAAREVIRAGGDADKLRHNCSGKHAAMLATCVVNDWPVSGYRELQHPLQQVIRAAIEDIADEPVSVMAVDGCGAPAFGLSLTAVARAFTRLVTAPTGTRERHVADAMRAHPFLVGGTDRDVTTLMQQIDGLIVKDGAEGVAAAATADGVGIALKIDDGGGRARTPVLVDVLKNFGHDMSDLMAMASPPVLGHGMAVGHVRACIHRTGDIRGK